LPRTFSQVAAVGEVMSDSGVRGMQAEPTAAPPALPAVNFHAQPVADHPELLMIGVTSGQMVFQFVWPVAQFDALVGCLMTARAEAVAKMRDRILVPDVSKILLAR
jgi:hypothetical protein